MGPAGHRLTWLPKVRIYRDGTVTLAQDDERSGDQSQSEAGQTLGKDVVSKTIHTMGGEVRHTISK